MGLVEVVKIKDSRSKDFHSKGNNKEHSKGYSKMKNSSRVYYTKGHVGHNAYRSFANDT